jgi:hypothetical protein
MVGDPEILETALARSFGHCLQSLGAVGGIRVAVKDPAQVQVVDELRQLALQSQLELTAPLPEFGFKEGQAEGMIDFGFVVRDQGTAIVQAVGLQPHSLLSSQRLELGNVSGRAGGKEKGGAKVLSVRQADLQSISHGRLRRFGYLGRFCDDREFTDEFAASASRLRL